MSITKTGVEDWVLRMKIDDFVAFWIVTLLNSWTRSWTDSLNMNLWETDYWNWTPEVHSQFSRNELSKWPTRGNMNSVGKLWILLFLCLSSRLDLNLLSTVMKSQEQNWAVKMDLGGCSSGLPCPYSSIKAGTQQILEVSSPQGKEDGLLQKMVPSCHKRAL